MADNDKPDQQGDAGNTSALTPMQQTAGLVAKYAGKLIDDERAQQFYARVLLLARQDPKIAMCTQDSLLASMMACVHLDLMPNTPEQLAFIIPYKNHKLNVMQAQFQLGYKGMIALAYKSAGIASINAELVFKEDTFEVDYGKRELTHKPNLTIDRTDYSQAVACYAVAIPVNGGQQIFDVMSRSEIDKVRKTVKAGSTDAPWATWEEAMVKKTVIKRLTKVLPQSSKDNRLQFAAAFDSWGEAGKLGINAKGEVVEAEPAASTVDPAKVAAEVAKAQAAVHTVATNEGDDPHRGQDDTPAAPPDEPPATEPEVPSTPPDEPEQAVVVTPAERKKIEDSIDKLGLNSRGKMGIVNAATGKPTVHMLKTDQQWADLQEFIASVKAGEIELEPEWLAKQPAKAAKNG